MTVSGGGIDGQIPASENLREELVHFLGQSHGGGISLGMIDGPGGLAQGRLGNFSMAPEAGMRWDVSMKMILFLVASLSVARADWVMLFDGRTTEGWTPRAKVEKFEAVDGELHLLSKTNVWVVSKLELADFEAELEVFLPDEPGFNSGLAFRCQGDQGKPKGYQIEIDRKLPGGVYGIGLGGWLSSKKGELKEGQWNHFRVRAKGDLIQTWVNGRPVSEIRDKGQLKGYFGIQHHGKGGLVRFRKIRVRDLSE